MNIHSSFDYILKLIIIGDSGVGKSNFLFRFIDNNFSFNYHVTVGVENRTKICTLPKSKKIVNLQLWDSAGQEKYMSICKIFFQKVQGIILMYDITNRDSFEHLSKWIQMINDTTYNIPVVLVGNKLDDEEDKRIVREEEGKAFAKENGYLFYEASAFNGKNVNNVLYDLCEIIISSLEISFSYNISQSCLENFAIKDKKKYSSRKEFCC